MIMIIMIIYFLIVNQQRTLKVIFNTMVCGMALFLGQKGQTWKVEGQGLRTRKWVCLVWGFLGACLSFALISFVAAEVQDEKTEYAIEVWLCL